MKCIDGVETEYRFTMKNEDIRSINFIEIITNDGAGLGEGYGWKGEDIPKKEKEKALGYLEKILK